MSDYKSLLPSGFRDLLPPEAELEDKAARQILDVCKSFGYQRVRPPLAEFEEALFSDGPGSFVKEQAFRFVDPVSQKMMAVRFDITAQIARIAASRMSDAPRPLRLMYANDVLRTQPSQQRLDRQFRQIGCEIVGQENVEADIEIAVVTLLALQAVLPGRDVTIDIAYTQLLYQILEACGIDNDARGEWLEMLASKNVAMLKARSEPFAQQLSDLIYRCGPLEESLAALKALKLGDAVATSVERLESYVRAIETAVDALGLPEVNLTIDPFEIRGFQYHSGLCFTLFTSQVPSEIGRGGRYEIPGKESACGFTLYMDALLKTVEPLRQEDKILVSADEDWDIIARLQSEGWIVERAIEEGAGQACTHVYRDGKAVKL